MIATPKIITLHILEVFTSKLLLKSFNAKILLTTKNPNTASQQAKIIARINASTTLFLGFE